MVLGALGLLYRATVYWDIPVEPGEPYSFGDILNGLFGLVAVGACILTTLSVLICLLVPGFATSRLL